MESQNQYQYINDLDNEIKLFRNSINSVCWNTTDSVLYASSKNQISFQNFKSNSAPYLFTEESDIMMIRHSFLKANCLGSCQANGSVTIWDTETQ